MNIILVGKDGRPSMKGVFQGLQNCILIVRRRLKNNTQYYRIYENGNSENFRRVNNVDNLVNEEATVLRWGNRMDISRVRRMFNRSESIANATNKKRSREIFMENDVRCPRLVTPQNYATINPSRIIARPLTHSKGRNFVVLNNREEFMNHWNRHNQGWYYSEFIDKSNEYRVHCGHGKVICVLEKPRPENRGQIAWNRAVNGEAFVHVPQEEVKKSVLLEALKAVEALGLDFGAADVIYSKPNAYVVEVNTSPTLNSSPLTTQKYRQYFQWLFTHSRPNQKWDFRRFEKGVSLLWKNFQFEAPIPNESLSTNGNNA